MRSHDVIMKFVAAAFAVLLASCVTERAPDEGLVAPRPAVQAVSQCPKVTPSQVGTGFDVGAAAYRRGDKAAALTAWESSAKAGEALAQYNLAVMLETGSATPQNDGLAACWYRAAAKQGIALAQNNLGVLYQDGRGVKQDYVRAADLYQTAAEAGLAQAQRNLAIMLEAGWGVPRDTDLAMKWLARAAETGYPPAERTLGMWFDAGTTTERDFEKAITWTQRAIDDGDADALSNMGWFYFRDQGAKQDLEIAIRNFKAAAAEGARTGQYNLALAYFDGKGVPKNREKAIALWRLAADQGFHPAMNWLGTAYDRGWGVERNPRLALEWYVRALEAGSIDAINNLGVVFRDGNGVNMDRARAKAFFEQADRRGHVMAAVNLAAGLEASGFSFDERRAFELYMKSAQRGLAHAQANVARMLENGIGVEEDLIRAFTWYSLAQQGNVGQAQSVDSYGAARARLLAERGIERLREKLTPQQIEKAETVATYFHPKILHGYNVVRGRADMAGPVLESGKSLAQAMPAVGVERYSERLMKPVKKAAAKLASNSASLDRPVLAEAALDLVKSSPEIGNNAERCRLINALKTSVNLPADCQFTQSMLDALTENLSGLNLASARDVPQTRVLLVAVEDYQSAAGKRSWPDLQYPVRDVERIADLLQHEFAMDVTVLKNPKSKKEVEAVFWDIHSSVRPMDQFLFIWSGHGIYSDWRSQGYLALSNTPMNVAKENQQAFLEDNEGDPYYHHYLSYNDIHAFLSGLDADVLFLVDACQSGLADTQAAYRLGRAKGIAVEPRGRLRIGITSSDDWGSAVPDKSPFMDALFAYLREVDDVGVEGNDRGLWGSMKQYVERQRAANQAVPTIHRYEIPGNYPENDSAFRFKPAAKAKQVSTLIAK